MAWEVGSEGAGQGGEEREGREGGGTREGEGGVGREEGRGETEVGVEPEGLWPPTDSE